MRNEPGVKARAGHLALRSRMACRTNLDQALALRQGDEPIDARNATTQLGAFGQRALDVCALGAEAD